MSGVVAGIGCRRDCPADEIVTLVRRAGAIVGRTAAALAAPAFKADEAGIGEAALLLGIPLVVVAAEALAQAQAGCPTRSAAAAQATGFASVAEGSALAAAGPGGRLLLARIAAARATCALAETAAP